MYYYRARWYDAAVGRFISEDPMEFHAEDMNLYRYVLNGSPNAIDPTGLFQIPVLRAPDDEDEVGLPDIDLNPDFNPFDDGEVGLDGAGQIGPTTFGGGIDVDIWNGDSDFWWWLQGNIPFGDDGLIKFRFDENCGTIHLDMPFLGGGGFVMTINTDYVDVFGKGTFDFPIGPGLIPGLGGGVFIDGIFDSNGDFDFRGGGRLEIYTFGRIKGCIEGGGRISSEPNKSGGHIGGEIMF